MVIHAFNNIDSKKKVLVTTEKDIVRIESEMMKLALSDLPLFYLPISINFSSEKDSFDQLILDYVRKN